MTTFIQLSLDDALSFSRKVTAQHERETQPFDGSTYSHERDGQRLMTQLERVLAFMQDGSWHTLREIAEKVGGSEASVSARCRDLRKPKWGGHTVERRHIKNGLFEYRLAA